jgi:hypothetical protein
LGGWKKRSWSGSEEPVFLEHGNQNIRKPVVREGRSEVRGQIAEVKPVAGSDRF